MIDLEVGDLVEVKDFGLALLRSLHPGMPPNHYGKVVSIDGATVMVEFPVEGGSQVAPYDIGSVVKR